MTDERSDDRLGTGGAFKELAAAQADQPDTFIGRDLGDYQVLGLIAEGGMGRVYRARRIDGSFEREVAVKLSPASGIDEQMRERFLQEQSVLAGLNHPHISQLYDAGMTEEGWPYIVMELIEGWPIDRYCSERQLNEESRIRLLIDVVNAVAYAHARLIVHRDLKPSNILVDTEGRVKLLDFGIAKLIDESSATVTQQRPMTPRYASPEQLLGQPVQVASDVYQLGLLIFEVMTGEPLEQSSSLADAIQTAAEGESVRLSAAQRHKLPGELIKIIEYTLRSNPDERYTSASELRDDLENYLRGYPVQAVGQSASYRIRKFLRRNLAATSIAAIAVLTISSSTVWYTNELTRERDQAERQERMADEALSFLTSILEHADPNNAQAGEMSINDVLEDGARRVEAELADQPEIQVRLFRTLAQIYDRLGEYDRVIPILASSERPTIEVYGRASPEYFALLNQQGNSLNRLGRFAEGREFFRSALQSAIERLGPDHRESIKVRNNLGISAYSQGDLEAFDEITEENFRIAEASLAENESLRINVAHKRAIALVVAGELDEAKALARRYAEIADKALGPAHANTLAHYSLLASAYGYAGEPDEELRIQKMIVDRKRQSLDPNHPDLAFSISNLAVAYEQNGQLDEAEPLLRETIEIREKSLGAAHPRTLYARRNLAQFLATHRPGQNGLQELEEVLAEQQQLLGPEHQDSVETQLAIASLLLTRGDPGADVSVAQAEALIERSIGSEHPVARNFLDTVARLRADASTDPE